ncbi:unnamed protein product [Orchesella dallaii]|uniref:Uncharacterized protein n=1 Tax=Orchesella dallaii TaxID=48710 RepID=A0ABP1S2T9_9HEXA
MSRLEKAPSGGESNTATTKASQFPRITVPKAGVPDGATLHHLQQQHQQQQQHYMLDKNGNPLDPKLVEGHQEIIWARRQMLKKRGTTIPSNLAIPVGLAQIGIGASMAILGVLAIRYQSYLFYYGSGLWTGMVVGITGALCAMCTKSGLPKPKWFCGGQRWQVHVLLATTMLSLSASVLLAIFSTAGLLQTAKTMVGVDMDDRTEDDETLDRRRSAGNIINSLLLLSSMLEVLLSFSTFGMAISVLCKSSYKASLLSSTGSSGSENPASREMITSTTEYQARKDRLLRWLGHQRRPFPGLPHPRGTLRPYVIPAQSVASSYVLPAAPPRPVFTLPPNYPASITIPHPAYSIIMPMHHPTHMPVVPLPMRRPTTPAAASHASVHAAAAAHANAHAHAHAHAHAGHHHGTLLLVPDDLRKHRSRQSSVSNLSVATRRSSKCSVASSSKMSVARRICEEKNKEVEITEEEVSKTYTGLDRSVAEDFITQTMNDGTMSSLNDNVSSNSSTSSPPPPIDEENDGMEGDNEDPEQEISRL